MHRSFLGLLPLNRSTFEGFLSGELLLRFTALIAFLTSLIHEIHGAPGSARNMKPVSDGTFQERVLYSEEGADHHCPGKNGLEEGLDDYDDDAGPQLHQRHLPRRATVRQGRGCKLETKNGSITFDAKHRLFAKDERSRKAQTH